MSTAIVPFPSDGNLFDTRPVQLDGFTLGPRSVVPKGTPSLQQWQAAWAFATAAEQSSPYWVGDLMAYAEGRQDWQERLTQAMSVTGLAQHTIENRTYISRHVAEHERFLAPSITHAEKVASLPRPEQTKFLEEARERGWTARELAESIRASKRARVIEGQAVLVGQYRVIYADPPWRYNDRGATKDGSLGKAERHYSTMTIDAIAKLPVQAHAAKNAVLFLWTTVPFLLLNPGPRDVLEAWGFTYKSNRTWNKVLGNPGHYGMQVTHEHCLIATRGHCLPDVPLPHDDSVWTERRTEIHSQKPAAMRQFIERHWTSGAKLELFGRERHEGWTVLGNDSRLWSEDAAAEGSHWSNVRSVAGAF